MTNCIHNGLGLSVHVDEHKGYSNLVECISIVYAKSMIILSINFFDYSYDLGWSEEETCDWAGVLQWSQECAIKKRQVTVIDFFF